LLPCLMWYMCLYIYIYIYIYEVIIVSFYWLLLKQRCHILSRVFQIIQSLNLNYGNVLIWQISVSQASRKQFLDSWEILCSLQLSKSWIPSWLFERPREVSGRPPVREDSKQLSIDSMIRPDDKATSSGCSP